MNIVILNGTQRRGSTYHITHQILDKLDPKIERNITEFFVPKDLPHFCLGCYNCIYKSELNCPHSSSVDPIRKAMRKADLIVIGSPVYVFDVSGQLKALFDHFGYQWMSHRPESSMFKTVGLSVVTGAGAGMKPTSKTILTNLRWWGIEKSFSFTQAVMASSYSEISPKILSQIDKKTTKLAKQISLRLLKKDRQSSMITKLLFKIMGMSKKGHPEWNEADHAYWLERGYLDGTKPWQSNTQS